MTGLDQIVAQAPAIGIALGGVAGLLCGSFLNVVIGRLPAIALDQNPQGSWPGALISPASHCPRCTQPIRARHNVPVIGYLLLRGRCHDCAAPIPLRYPMVELAGGLLGVAAVWALGFTLPALALGIFVLSLLALAVIDLDHQILPDQIVLPMMWLGLLVNAFTLLTTPADAILGAAAGFAALTAIRLAYLKVRGVEGMGQGDAKLAAMVGAWLGLQAVMTSLLLAFVVGTIVAGIAIALKRMTSDQRMPFGPAIAVGALAAAMGVNLY